MKILAVTALVLGMSFGNLTDKKPLKEPVEPFSQKYFTQLDKANAALRDYLSTPCDVPEHKQTAEAFVKEANLLSGMYKAIPLGEDEILRAHEVEVIVGFDTVAQDGIDEKSKECAGNIDNVAPSQSL